MSRTVSLNTVAMSAYLSSHECSRQDPTTTRDASFEPFSMPPITDALSEASVALDKARQAAMTGRNAGVTTIYNLVNDPDCADPTSMRFGARMRQPMRLPARPTDGTTSRWPTASIRPNGSAIDGPWHPSNRLRCWADCSTSTSPERGCELRRRGDR